MSEIQTAELYLSHEIRLTHSIPVWSSICFTQGMTSSVLMDVPTATVATLASMGGAPTAVQPQDGLSQLRAQWSTEFHVRAGLVAESGGSLRPGVLAVPDAKGIRSKPEDESPLQLPRNSTARSVVSRPGASMKLANSISKNTRQGLTGGVTVATAQHVAGTNSQNALLLQSSITTPLPPTVLLSAIESTPELFGKPLTISSPPTHSDHSDRENSAPIKTDKVAGMGTVDTGYIALRGREIGPETSEASIAPKTTTGLFVAIIPQNRSYNLVSQIVGALPESLPLSNQQPTQREDLGRHAVVDRAPTIVPQLSAPVWDVGKGTASVLPEQGSAWLLVQTAASRSTQDATIQSGITGHPTSIQHENEQTFVPQWIMPSGSGSTPTGETYLPSLNLGQGMGAVRPDQSLVDGMPTSAIDLPMVSNKTGLQIANLAEGIFQSYRSSPTSVSELASERIGVVDINPIGSSGQLRSSEFKVVGNDRRDANGVAGSNHLSEVSILVFPGRQQNETIQPRGATVVSPEITGSQTKAGNVVLIENNSSLPRVQSELKSGQPVSVTVETVQPTSDASTYLAMARTTPLLDQESRVAPEAGIVKHAVLQPITENSLAIPLSAVSRVPEAPQIAKTPLGQQLSVLLQPGSLSPIARLKETISSHDGTATAVSNVTQASMHVFAPEKTEVLPFDHSRPALRISGVAEAMVPESPAGGMSLAHTSSEQSAGTSPVVSQAPMLSPHFSWADGLEAARNPFHAIDSGMELAGLSGGSLARNTAGPHSLEVGYQDPSLGYLELRAHMAGNGVHASLTAESTSSAALLEGHMGPLSGWLQERHTTVESLTIFAPRGDNPFGGQTDGQGGRHSGGQMTEGSGGSDSRHSGNTPGSKAEVGAAQHHLVTATSLSLGSGLEWGAVGTLRGERISLIA